MSAGVEIRVYATNEPVFFDRNRRFPGSSAITVLTPGKSNPNREETPLTVDVTEGGLVSQVDEFINIGPWEGGRNPVPNLRHYHGSLDELLEELKALGDVVKVD